MILEASTVQGGIDVAKGISEYGLLAIAAGFFVVMSVVQQIMMNKRYTAMSENQDLRYDKLFTALFEKDRNIPEDIKNLTKSIEDLITPLSLLLQNTQDDMREECTEQQAVRVIKNEVEIMRIKLVAAVRGIIKRNSVHENPNATKDKVDKVVANCYKYSMQSMNMFKFTGRRLGTYLQDSFKSKFSDTCYTFIMVEGQKNYEKFENDLSLISEELYNCIVSQFNEQ